MLDDGKRMPRPPVDELGGGQAKTTFADAAARYADESVKTEIEAAANETAAFVMANTDRYTGEGHLQRGEPIVDLDLLDSLLAGEGSAFLKGRNRENARRRVFANAMTRMRYELSERGVLDNAFVAEAHSTVVDERVELLLGDLEHRRQSTKLDGRLSLAEITSHFYKSVDSTTKPKVRDKYLVVLAKLGLMTSNYREGEGYLFRAGPVLTAVVTRAVEPFLIAHSL